MRTLIYAFIIGISLMASANAQGVVPLPYSQPAPQVQKYLDQIWKQQGPKSKPRNSASSSGDFQQVVPFRYLRTYENVHEDPDKIWQQAELEPRPGMETVTIQEYAAENSQGRWIISQLWDAGCSTDLCPTRLVLKPPNGERKLKLTDMLYQVAPLNDKQFLAEQTKTVAGSYLNTPFVLSSDGKTLMNGNFSFKIN